MNTLPETVLSSEIESFLQDSVSSQFLGKAKKFTSRFCKNGQIAVASFIVFAEEDGKTKEAFRALQTTWDEHWHYQHPDVRGDPNHSSNIEKLGALYSEIGIIPPWVKR